MTESTIRKIKLDQFPCDAWVKRFPVIVGNPSDDKPLLSYNTAIQCAPESIKARIEKDVNSWMQHALLDTLTPIINDVLAGKTTQAFTIVQAHPVYAPHNPESAQSSKWSDDKGTISITSDISDLAAKLCEKMRVSPFADMTMRHMTLIISTNHKKTIQPPSKNSCSKNVVKVLKDCWPNIKIVYLDAKEKANSSFALLILDERTPGLSEIGYLELQDSIMIMLVQEDMAPRCKLDFPAYQLSLLDPKQIAVLTGI